VDIKAVGEGEDSDEETAQAEGVSSGFAFPAPTHILVTPDVSEDDPVYQFCRLKLVIG
jgi:hypothetical protein